MAKRSCNEKQWCCAAKHLVLYEDGDKEWLNLTAERVEWEQEEQPESNEAEVSSAAAPPPQQKAHSGEGTLSVHTRLCWCSCCNLRCLHAWVASFILGNTISRASCFMHRLP